jgi:hypothetical protein
LYFIFKLIKGVQMKIHAQSRQARSLVLIFAVSLMAQVAAPLKTTASPADSAKTSAKKDSLASDTAKGGYGKLHVVSQPDSAVVVVDSMAQGLAPFSLDSVPAGPHTILVKKKGYFIKKISIVIRKNEAEELTVSLVRPGSLYVKSDPAGARCFIDSKETGKTPCEISKLKPGDYNVRLELVNRTEQDRIATVRESLGDTLMVQMPFTVHYLDSVAAAAKAEKDKKARQNKIRNYAVAAVFGAFAIAILIIEAVDR